MAAFGPLLVLATPRGPVQMILAFLRRCAEVVHETPQFRHGQSNLVRWCVLHSPTQHDQIGMSQQGERNMAGPGKKTSHLILVQADFTFGLLKPDFYRPATTGNAY